METMSCLVLIDIRTHVLRHGVTPAEAMVITNLFDASQAMNFEAVLKKKVGTGSIERSMQDEKARLLARYGRKAKGVAVVEQLFPGHIAGGLPVTFSEAGITLDGRIESSEPATFTPVEAPPEPAVEAPPSNPDEPEAAHEPERFTRQGRRRSPE